MSARATAPFGSSASGARSMITALLVRSGCKRPPFTRHRTYVIYLRLESCCPNTDTTITHRLGSSKRVNAMDQQNSQSTTSPPRSTIGSEQVGANSGLPFRLTSPRHFASNTHSFPEGSVRTSSFKQVITQVLEELRTSPDKPPEGRGRTRGTTTADTTSDEAELTIFQEFDERMSNLDRGFRAFENAIQQLGSSGGLMSASKDVRKQLFSVRVHFRENAATLLRGPSRPSHKSSNPNKSHDIEPLPKDLRQVAKDLGTFRQHVKDMSEFRQDAWFNLDSSTEVFVSDLTYYASCLDEFKGGLSRADVAQRINDLMDPLGARLDDMRSALDGFIEAGVPAIYAAQKHAGDGLQSLSTVATFFSAVTATTIQFSYNAHEIPLQDVVNALWLSSLVFSITSAINSQISYHWQAATYRSPTCHVPWWITVWLTHTPLYLLVISVMSFLAGLGAFTYSSEQSPAVSAVVISITIAASFFLVCICLWIIAERWTFGKTGGSRWLIQYLKGHVQLQTLKGHVAATKAVQTFQRSFSQARTVTYTTSKSVTDALKQFYWERTVPTFQRLSSSTGTAISGTSQRVVANVSRGASLAAKALTFNSQVLIDEESQASGGTHAKPPASQASPQTGRGSRFGISLDTQLEPDTEIVPGTQIVPGAYITSSPTQGEWIARFREIVHRVIAASKNARPPHSCTHDGEQMLRQLRSGQELVTHMMPTKHLQFSPDGKLLATYSTDRTVQIWSVDASSLTPTHMLRHKSFVPGQVAWSPSGDTLLIKQPKLIQVWDPNSGTRQRVIYRYYNVRSVTWLNSPGASPKILSVEWRMDTESRGEDLDNPKDHVASSYLCILDHTEKPGQEELEGQRHNLGRFQVWDAAVMPDGDRVIAVATRVRPRLRKDLLHTKLQNEKRILVYNLSTRKIEYQVPVTQEVRRVSLTKTGDRALVSYKNYVPPQLWRVEMIEKVYQLSLQCTYATKELVKFAGASRFGGANDEFVIAGSKGGEIHVWECSSGKLLHSIRTPDREITNVAWNPDVEGRFMLACATEWRTVRILTASTSPNRASCSGLGEPGDRDASLANQEPNQPGSSVIAGPTK